MHNSTVLIFFVGNVLFEFSCNEKIVILCFIAHYFYILVEFNACMIQIESRQIAIMICFTVLASMLIDVKLNSDALKT